MKNNLYHNILFLLVLTLISLPLHLEAENKLTQVDSLLNQIYIECETENTLNLSLSDFKKHFKYIQSEQVYAYDSISGPISLVLDQESDFFFLKNTDSTFHYSVGGLEKKGQWDLKLDTLSIFTNNIREFRINKNCFCFSMF